MGIPQLEMIYWDDFPHFSLRTLFKGGFNRAIFHRSDGSALSRTCHWRNKSTCGNLMKFDHITVLYTEFDLPPQRHFHVARARTCGHYWCWRFLGSAGSRRMWGRASLRNQKPASHNVLIYRSDSHILDTKKFHLSTKLFVKTFTKPCVNSVDGRKFWRAFTIQSSQVWTYSKTYMCQTIFQNIATNNWFRGRFKCHLGNASVAWLCIATWVFCVSRSMTKTAQ